MTIHPRVAWRVLIALLAMLGTFSVVAGGASSQPAPTAPSGEELGHVRFEQAKKFSGRWQTSFGSDTRTRAILFQEEVKTPTSADEVDIVATVTIDYRLTSSDKGDIRFDFTPVGQDTELSFDPGPYPLSGTEGALDTRTFVWSERGVPAAGETYSFQLETGARDGRDAGQSAAGSGSKVSVVIEMWPAD